MSSYSTTGNDPNYLKLSGGNLTGNLTGTTISASNVSSTEFTGSGTNIYNLDNNKIVYNRPNLNLYSLKSYVDGSLNIINTTKQNLISVSSPLIKDVNNNITIDLTPTLLNQMLMIHWI